MYIFIEYYLNKTELWKNLMFPEVAPVKNDDDVCRAVPSTSVLQSSYCIIIIISLIIIK